MAQQNLNQHLLRRGKTLGFRLHLHRRLNTLVPAPPGPEDPLGQIPVDPEPILATGGSPGKPAIARAALALAGERLRGEGIVDVGGFCVAYLAEGRPAYVPKFKLSAADAVASIRRCGGHPVWAHPAVDLRQPPSSPGLQRELRHVAEELVEAGLEGLEAGNLSHTPAEAAAVERVAAALGLRTSAGSDFHDPDDPETARLLLD
ncbi:MAG: hypothetical protein QGF68_16590, partial [Nitrospinota bacterium]|nr:hypothetical protein [Nitrospinota bacterium]